MNFKIVFYLLGWILIFEAFFMMLPCLVGILYGEHAALAFAISALLCMVLGFLITRFKPGNTSLFAKEGFIIVALSWIFLSIFGALPFVISGTIPGFINALFETASGFTTTGATILTDVEVLPKCINFWRCFTHWIGGMGVLVFMMAILPLAGGYNMYLMKAESPGPVVGKLVPHVKATAKILYIMYLCMTVTQIIFLLIGRMNLYEAVTTAFGTAGTGGFGIRNDSIGGYSAYIQIVVTVFMILFGVSFNFYHALINRKWKDALSMSEVRIYFFVILAAIIAVTIDTASLFDGVGTTIRHAAFQVGAIITTTGFATTDFNQWPSLSKTILVILMFVGACAGSTGGGMKVSRFIIWIKSFFKEMQVIIHPRTVRKVAMDGKNIEHEVIRSVNVFLVSYVLIFMVSILCISLDEFDLITNFTAIAATLNNVGPGLEMVGPTGNFSDFSAFSKLVMTFDMIAGRLELFPLLVLLSPATWKK